MEQREARWPALIALVGVGGLYLAMPRALTLGPRWLPLLIIGLCIFPIMVSYRRRNYRLNEWSAYIVLGVITTWMLISLGLLIVGMAHHTESPKALLLSAGLLWV